MEIKKINDLTYAFHFDTDIQMKTLFRYLYKSSEKYCYDENIAFGCARKVTPRDCEIIFH